MTAPDSQPAAEPESIVTAEDRAVEEIPAVQPVPASTDDTGVLPAVQQGETGQETERTEPPPATVPYTQPVQKRFIRTGRYRLPYKMRVIVCAVRKPRNDNGGSYDNTE